MVQLKDFMIDFDYTKGIPFFQVHQNNRIRFDLYELSLADFKSIINEVFPERKDINAIFISAYIFNGKRRSAKSRVGLTFQLNNWKEYIVGEDKNNAVVYASIKNLSSNDIYNYCLSIRKGGRPAYISFYSNDYLLYVSTDVIDIVSNDTMNIAKLKDDYNGLYDTYYAHQ
ncbi:hypothetical protein CHN50_09710 [Priestia aryabhattai]|uniref:hypothetical protein n=1 Tax=Bacillaceae TaxID=186817 RepID=UPI000BA0052B|nr:hypothetical protein [Bacillus sp. CBEL-1]OZT12702.1 hypothetical protein CHN50_09710 [Priestia aryabhattai]TDB53840.1 hypothetical protein EPL02_05495 [Bacillus sp. CBEL-1]